MGPSVVIKLVFLVVILTITTSLAFQNANVYEENYEGGLTSRNISEVERSTLERELRAVRKRGRRLRRRSRFAAGTPDAVVAQDGSGNYETINEALDASLRRIGGGRFVIYIKRGVYREKLVVSDKMVNIMLIGDGIGQTIITASDTWGSRKTTWSAATVVVNGDGFVARDITFQNTAQKAQAPAITTNSQRLAFFRCGFDGYQDTIFASHGQQFYRECDVYGTVDFICGDPAAIFQNSNIYVRGRTDRADNEITITASKREEENSPTGIIFQNCRIMAVPELRPMIGRYRIYLGRPWGQYSRTVFIESDFDVPVDPQGWLEWEGRSSFGNDVYYAEYNNRGMGSSTRGRVGWAGVKVITNPNDVQQFTVANFIQGHTWLPSTGVPFTPGL